VPKPQGEVPALLSMTVDAFPRSPYQLILLAGSPVANTVANWGPGGMKWRPRHNWFHPLEAVIFDEMGGLSDGP
jgi:hypothetical protein